MEKTQIGANFFIPMPMVLVGTQVGGKANFMTMGWCARANANPPMVVCGIGKHHYTPKGIAETKTFSVNIPSSHLLEKTDFCGLVSGEKARQVTRIRRVLWFTENSADDQRMPGHA